MRVKRQFHCSCCFLHLYSSISIQFAYKRLAHPSSFVFLFSSSLLLSSSRPILTPPSSSLSSFSVFDSLGGGALYPTLIFSLFFAAPFLSTLPHPYPTSL